MNELMNEAVSRDQTRSCSQHSECLPQPRDKVILRHGVGERRDRQLR